MPDRPTAITRLESLLAVARISHEAIFDLHRELAAAERAGNESAELVAESAELVAESARIATAALPALAGRLREPVTRWEEEESLLDPQAADSTEREIAAGLAAVEPEMRSLLARQGEIAARLRALLG